MLKIKRPSVPISMQGTINRINTEANADKDMTAHEDILAERYFAVGNRCFKALEVIVTGEKIVPGQNCEEINIASALNALNAKGE